MKRLIILSTILLTLFNCSVNEKPEFLGVENIKILESTPEYIILTADALFENPNIIGGELEVSDIKVYVNNSEMASVSSNNFEIPAKKEFSIPLTANVPIDSIFGDENLSSLIGSLLTKKIKVNYKGVINYKVLGYSHSYEVDKTEDVKIK
ncbi:LEA type 2 family protein [Mariniflexile gromovii]|uniref:LEA type 2 family protein n=1 Tax=Mariniflexile gromovii TaxID=362523 RepID=A0ABS4BYS9_9FLAO|nr:LEA type 2 family protein [Mariniflexile gromovii]MBP0905187.1 LEA type 2 family protein [Mariniflexile gromovii]